MKVELSGKPPGFHFAGKGVVTMGIRGSLVKAYAGQAGKRELTDFLARLLGLDADREDTGWRTAENGKHYAKTQPGYTPWAKNADSAAALDEEIWRTTEEGNHFRFETSTGEIKSGFGGRFNGKKIGESWGTKKNGEPMRPKSSASEVESLRKQISGLSRFGEQGKKRKELEAQLRSMTEKPKEPEKKSGSRQAPQDRPVAKENPGHPVTPHKEKQFEIIQKTNPMLDEYHTGIRKPSDIMSPEEAFGSREDYVYPDFTPEDGEKALRTGQITLYSSHPIEDGAFVTPSKMMAGDYAGEGQIYSKTVPLSDVAWINAGEGQFAHIEAAPEAAELTEGAAGSTAEPQKKEAPESPERAKWKAGLDKKRGIAMKWDSDRQAEYLFRQGFLTEDEAIEAMNNGTAGDRISDYFDLLEYNGDPTPTKPVRDSRGININKEVMVEGKHNGDFAQARLDYIRDWTGMNEEEAKKARGELKTWFSFGNWKAADTDTLDDYIDRDGVYGGEIFRGLHFTEDEYAAFMKDIKSGARIGMNGFNSSWATDRETAWGFARGLDKQVIIHCINNKTGAPVDHLSDKGENEVLANSRTMWTVIGVKEGDQRAEITVMEAEERMSVEERDRRKNLNDAMPEDKKDGSLADRMNEQNRYLRVTPPPENLFKSRVKDQARQKLLRVADTYAKLKSAGASDEMLRAYFSGSGYGALRERARG